MGVHDFTSQRLYVEAPLDAGIGVALSPDQASYLRGVLRMPPGAKVLVFNGRDGEWRAVLEHLGKRDCVLRIEAQTRAQAGGPDVDYLFAPLKKARLDYMVQKAVELGVGRLRPVITRRTVAERVKLERMRANVVEAAEQCGILRLSEVQEPEALDRVIAGWDAKRTLIFCDEAEADGTRSPIAALEAVPEGPLALLIGPEGGFDDSERLNLKRQPFVVSLPLGPRVMRADTAAVAALALIMALRGDWRA
jgi:16S rRNA (uracil1498-N3)-methyltransferase